MTTKDSPTQEAPAQPPLPPTGDPLVIMLPAYFRRVFER